MQLYIDLFMRLFIAFIAILAGLGCLIWAYQIIKIAIYCFRN